MRYRGLKSFVDYLESQGELKRVAHPVNPELEITEITDRITKSGGQALLFENNGTKFPVLINAFGSPKRMALALGTESLEKSASLIEKEFAFLAKKTDSLTAKLSKLPSLVRLAGFIPSKSSRKGLCQENIILNPDLSILPVLKCWPHDGGRFITLPVVNTIHPVSGNPNAGMYRMQILDKNTTAMHWQLHKTGAAHYLEWKNAGKKMPVSVVLGGDPIYSYAASAPLPENIDEYMFAGFLRGRKVKLVKCITNDIYVPEDADIVIEGFVDPDEQNVLEGPFGDHTGFYSLADHYPRFHVTCITHCRNAIYPATIVGVPPQEDAYIAMATEKIFLAPIKFTLLPEVVDLHMPEAGVAHNLSIVKIRRSYPGQGMKAINSLLGAGQMMFTKYMIVVNSEVNIRDYEQVFKTVLSKTNFSRDVLFCRGPMDVLDHSSDDFAYGGKAGIDASGGDIIETDIVVEGRQGALIEDTMKKMQQKGFISDYCIRNAGPFYASVISVFNEKGRNNIDKVSEVLASANTVNLKLVLVVDSTVDVNDLLMVAWQVSGNSDPLRDHRFISADSILIDGTIKANRNSPFPRPWPNVVCSDEYTINNIDGKWKELGLGGLIPSPSGKYRKLVLPGGAEILRGS